MLGETLIFDRFLDMFQSGYPVFQGRIGKRACIRIVFGLFEHAV